MKNFHISQLPKNPRILIIKLRSIGDLVYNTSIYQPLKEALPESHVTLVVDRFTLDIVKDNPYLDEVICPEKKPFHREAAFYIKLLMTHYDAVIDMHGGPRSAFMSLFCGAKHRIGNNLSKRAKFYNIKLAFDAVDYAHPLYTQVGYLKKIGIPVENPKPKIYLSPEREAKANELLVSLGITKGTPFCILHIGAKKKCYDWKPENYAGVIDYCASRHGLKVIIDTIPSQKNVVQEIIDKLQTKNYTLIIEKLQESTAIAKSALFVIAQDGGYIHINSAIGTPVIAMFGPTNVNWMPKGKHNKLVSKHLECSPCSIQVRKQPGKEECDQGNAECMRLMTINDVTEKVDELMKEVIA